MFAKQTKTWTDDALVRAIQMGGPARDAALRAWFSDKDLHAWVNRYALRHGGSAADGEDLYHDAFLSFDRSIREDKFRGEASLKTFFCSIAKWQWVNKMRKTGRIVALESHELIENERIAEDAMYDRERQEAFQHLLAGLGDKCKRLLTMYQLSYSMKEIAAEMGYASDQVAMNQSSNCRKKLKELLENDPELLAFIRL